ncbi:MAG TPA: AAA family ATPase, partial [Prevotella sp.]|nr:AAA family ATPase [Prevotella sp.]
FGKSLLVSTFQSYFEGRKDLFKGLAIERLEVEWKAYPVLHFSLAGGKHMEKEQLERYLLFILNDNEKRFGVECDSPDPNVRLINLIKTVHQKTGRQVVVLVDEYDAPLLDVVHERQRLDSLRNTMRNFYSPLKDCEPMLRFVFLTGITKFSQLSIFSELNNISNISMDDDYAGICGITMDELTTQMSADVDALAEKLGKTREETLEKLREYYDGYHFAAQSPDVFNPYSLLNAMARGKMDHYWFSSGTPTYLIEMLRKFHVMPSEIGSGDADKSEFDAPTESMTSVIPLLYQSGYITIKGYDPETELYTLDIPNKEIRVGLYRCLLPSYIGTNTVKGTTTIAKMSALIRRNDMDGALEMLQAFLETVPYCQGANTEGHYQQMMYVIFSILNHYVDVEVRTPRGRVDMVLRTATHLYLFELKLNKDAATAMRQIDLKQYPKRFMQCGLPVVKVGINFDVKKHNITDWTVEELS